MIAEYQMILERYKRTTEIANTECCMGDKQCLTCPNKYPCKVHKAYRYWEGSAVCLRAKRGMKNG